MRFVGAPVILRSWGVSGMLWTVRSVRRMPFATTAALLRWHRIRAGLPPKAARPRRSWPGVRRPQTGLQPSAIRTLLRKRNRIDGSPPVRRAEFGGGWVPCALIQERRNTVSSEVEERIHKALARRPLERIEHGYRLGPSQGGGGGLLRAVRARGVRGAVPIRSGS